MDTTNNTAATAASAQPVSDQYQGISNPPNDGNVTTVDPTAQEKGNTSADAGQPATQPQQGQPGPQAQPGPGPGQSAGQSAVPPGAKPPAANAPAQQAPAPQTNPSVRRAGWLHNIAETLAGGPRYTTQIDVNTGEMKRTAAPMSRGDIAMAIALEALSGSLAGLGEHGPGATGRAASDAYRQQFQQTQQRQEKQDEQSQADFARHAQVLELNLRQRQNALSAGRMSQEMNEKVVSQWAPLYAKLQKDHPEAIKATISESDFGKYNVTKDSAIPIGVTPRLDSDGHQITSNTGEPQWDMRYAVVDPNTKINNFLSPEQMKLGAQLGMPGLVNSDGKPIQNLPMDMPTKMSLWMNYASRITSFQLAQQDFSDYYKTLNEGNGDNGVPTNTPQVKDANMQSVIDQAADKYGVPKALARAMAMQESGSLASGTVNPRAVSPKGAQGLFQLMPATAHQYGVNDSFDPAKNADGGMHYMSDLLKQTHGDIKQALSIYNSGRADSPKNGETPAYISAITNAIGLEKSGGTGDKGEYQAPDLLEEAKKNPALTSELEQYMAAFNHGGQDHQKALSYLAEQNPQAAGDIAKLLGGASSLQAFQLAQKWKLDELDIRKKEQEAANKQKQDDQTSQTVIEMLTPPDDFKFTPDMYDMSMEDLRKHLTDSGVKIPADYASLYKQAHYEASPAQFANRIWRKGDKVGISRADANSYITQYIKPDYNDTNYDQIRARKVAIGNPNNKDNQAITNAGTAANHLQMLTAAAEALHNGNITVFNHYANQFGISTGQSAPLVYRALAEKVNQEVEKVAAGGTTPYKDSIENGFANISDDKSLQQIRDVAKAYTGLMYGRVNSIDESYNGITGEHLPNVPKSASDLFASSGMDTPWVKNQAKAGPKTPPSGPPNIGDVREYKGQLVRITRIDPNTGQFDAEPVGRAEVFKPVPMR